MITARRPLDSMTEDNEEVAAIDVPVPRPGITRGALESLDKMDLRSLFTQSLMKLPRCLVGPFRNALRDALAEVSGGAGNPVQLERGWKLFLLLLRMLLHRPPRGGLISKSQLTERFDKFARGEWVQLIHASVQCHEQAAVIRRRKAPRGRSGTSSNQGTEFRSSGRAGTEYTLKKLSDTSMRADRLLDPKRSWNMSQQCHSLRINVRSAKRGIAGGHSGMIVEHLRPLLDSPRDHRLLHTLAEGLAQGVVFESIVDTVRLGRMTALSKPDGGVRYCGWRCDPTSSERCSGINCYFSVHPRKV